MSRLIKKPLEIPQSVKVESLREWENLRVRT